MPDEPTDNPSTPESNGSKKRQRGEINLKYLAEINLCTDLVREARITERVASLGKRSWPAARVTALETLAGTLETIALRAVGRVSARKLDTEEKETARQAMLDTLHPIRVGAKRTYRGKGQEAGRDAFYVNEPVNVSLERLLFIAGEILLKISPQPDEAGTGTNPPEVVLDGVIEEDITALETCRAGYVRADDEKEAASNASKQAHVDVEQAFIDARAERIDLQLAADQAFPHTAPNGLNNAVRNAFKIPEDRPATE